MIDGLFAAVGQDFDDPPIGFQAHPQHGHLRLKMSANALADSAGDES